MIPVYKPFLSERTINYAKSALEEGWISSNGRFKDMATELLCEKTGSKYAYLTCNGTAACHMMIKSVEKFHPYKHNIAVPNNCYVAAWNSLLFDGNPMFINPVDSHQETWNMDDRKIPRNISILMVVHNLGSIVNVPRIRRERPELLIIEDACEAMFGSYEGHPAGSQSFCSVFSFFGNKNISSGEGGAVVSNDGDVIEYVKHLSEQSQTKDRFIHDELGYNYRMSNIHAAILYGQLQDYDEIKERKKEVFSNYNELIKDLPLEIQRSEEDTKHSLWMYGVKFESEDAKNRASKALISKGIESRPMFYPMSKHEHLEFRSHPSVEVNSKDLSDRCLMLPSYPDLTRDDINNIVGTIKESL